MSVGKFVVGKCGFGKFACRKICRRKNCVGKFAVGKFGVGKFMSENLPSEKLLSEKPPRPDENNKNNITGYPLRPHLSYISEFSKSHDMNNRYNYTLYYDMNNT